MARYRVTVRSGFSPGDCPPWVVEPGEIVDAPDDLVLGPQFVPVASDEPETPADEDGEPKPARRSRRP